LIKLCEKLSREHSLTHEECVRLVRGHNPETDYFLAQQALKLRQLIFGDTVFYRGLIEISSFCKNDCKYCGLRRSNKLAPRYRLSEEEIFSGVEKAYSLNFGTVVLQGGEDAFFSPEYVERIVKEIKRRHPEIVVTLSLGEHSRDVYKLWREAGAQRYLLRHETANKEHYDFLHPKEMSQENRLRALNDIRELGYMTGCGFLVGAPGESVETIADNLMFLQSFKPDMVGIGPFIPATGTPFENESSGSIKETLFLLSVIRLLLPNVYLPATTALATLSSDGYEQGLRAGANVIMPNCSPERVLGKYTIYDGKNIS
jgi:biotin synthase